MEGLPLSGKKAFREGSWSVIFILILTIGMTGWMTIPSVGSSIQHAISNYANAAATYVVVEDNNNPSFSSQALSSSLQDQIIAIKGVEAVYPVVVLSSDFLRTALSPMSRLETIRSQSLVI